MIHEFSQKPYSTIINGGMLAAVIILFTSIYLEMNENDVIVNLLYSVFWAGLITMCIYFVINKVVVPWKKPSMLEKAKRDGHAVIANLQEWSVENANYEWACYTFEYDNNTYFYDFYDSKPAPKAITLYFKSNPREATTEKHFGKVTSELIPLFVCLIICVWFITIFL